jgi:hypothetical protein
MQKEKFLLSLLICTVPEEINELNTLLESLHKQLQKELLIKHFVQQTITNGNHYFFHVAYPTVEILVCGDRGDLSVKEKKQLLRDNAQGDNCHFIDSESDVSELISLIKKQHLN